MIAPSFVSAETFTDVEYGRVGDISLRMDANIPNRNLLNPAVILVHGGGWVRGDRVYNVKPLFQPLEHAGIAWFSISYRLANDVMNFGAAVQDVEQAVRFVKTHAAEYRVDPARIALVGESAGGHLAEMAALSGEKDASVKAVVSFYGPTDLVTLARTSPLIPDPVRQAVEGSPFAGLLINRLKALSPIEFVSKQMPPFLLIHGTADTVVPYEQSRVMAQKIKAAGAECDLVSVPGGTHGLWKWDQAGLLTAASQSMVTWLKVRL